MSEISVERIIESLLFASSNRMSVDELVALSESTKKKVEAALESLITKFDSKDSSLAILHEDDWYKLGLKDEYFPYAEKLMPSTELPKPVVETLAMIAWKSPILQSDLVKLRSPAVYDHIMELQKLHLIIRVKQGRSYVLKVTEKFHDYFDIPKEKAEKMFSAYQEPSEDDAEFNKGDSFDETDEDRENRLIAEIKNNKIDPSAIIASDKEFLDDFDNRLRLIEEESGKVDAVLQEAEEIERELEESTHEAKGDSQAESLDIALPDFSDESAETVLVRGKSDEVFSEDSVESDLNEDDESVKEIDSKIKAAKERLRESEESAEETTSAEEISEKIE